MALYTINYAQLGAMGELFETTLYLRVTLPGFGGPMLDDYLTQLSTNPDEVVEKLKLKTMIAFYEILPSDNDDMFPRLRDKDNSVAKQSLLNTLYNVTEEQIKAIFEDYDFVLAVNKQILVQVNPVSFTQEQVDLIVTTLNNAELSEPNRVIANQILALLNV